MCFLEYYYQNIIKYDLLNKFQYNNLKNMPKIKKIILNFNYKTPGLKELSTALLALELITYQKGILTTSKNSNILLKVRKGSLTGCKVILQKNRMNNFFAKFFIEVLPRLKKFSSLNLNSLQKNSTVSYSLKNTLIFFELERNYSLFNNLPKLNVTIVIKSSIQKEFIFLLNSFKLPINIKNNK
jgi:large subunit ribosomal protein L5